MSNKIPNVLLVSSTNYFQSPTGCREVDNTQEVAQHVVGEVIHVGVSTFRVVKINREGVWGKFLHSDRR